MLIDSDFGPRTALIEGATGERWSYDRLLEAAHELAAPLQGSRSAFVLARTDVATVVSYLAALEARVPVTLLSADADDDATADLIARYRPDHVLGRVSDAALPAGWRREPAQGGIERASHGEGSGVDPDPALAVCLSTSGSTGSPKLVRLSATAVKANADSIAEALEIQPDDRAIATLPLPYSYGLSVLNSHLRVGAAVVLTEESVMGRGFWEMLGRHEVTSFAGVPYTYRMLKRLNLDELPTDSLRVMTQAGGKLDVPTAETFHDWVTEKRGGRWFTMYGQTEATARISILPAGDFARKPGSVGRAIPRGELRIEEDEIVYRGPNVMLGYAERPEDFARGDELGGELHTGDLGHLDEDGFLFVTGRNKRIGKLFGMRINLDEIEDVLRPHGPTAAVADTDRLVVFTEWGDPDELVSRRKALAERLRVFPKAVELRRIDALPRTASGKIDYAELKRAV